jgi:hypothetical protein
MSEETKTEFKCACGQVFAKRHDLCIHRRGCRQGTLDVLRSAGDSRGVPFGRSHQARGVGGEAMKTIHLVRAWQGEYSDHNEWTVAAYLDEAQAKTHVVLAQAEARAMKIAFDEWEDDPEAEYDDQPKGRSRHDADLGYGWLTEAVGKVVSSEVTYWLEETELRAQAPKGDEQ